MVETASVHILELGVDLDRALNAESRPTERLRMLRESTNRITRTANDAIDAYRKAKLRVDKESMKPGMDSDAIEDLVSRLSAARLELLRVLAVAAKRYPSESDEGRNVAELAANAGRGAGR
jgi:hypothetical protein